MANTMVPAETKQARVQLKVVNAKSCLFSYRFYEALPPGNNLERHASYWVFRLPVVDPSGMPYGYDYRLDFTDINWERREEQEVFLKLVPQKL